MNVWGLYSMLYEESANLKRAADNLEKYKYYTGIVFPKKEMCLLQFKAVPGSTFILSSDRTINPQFHLEATL